MPLVLAMNEDSESGISYDDLPYVRYEYPSMYRNRIRSGERFVYYRGRRRSKGGRQPQVYLGTGVIGEIRLSRRAGRYTCDILDGRRFEESVYFKDELGMPLEPDGRRRGYYQPGVRAIAETVFADIVRRGAAKESGLRPTLPAAESGSGLYADAATGRGLETYSRRVAVEILRSHYPTAQIQEMPSNHPGFDLSTNIPGRRFVEVKATQVPWPRFLLSEGERQFAASHSKEYLVLVVYGIDLEQEQHQAVVPQRGSYEEHGGLTAIQWAGELPITDHKDL